MIRFAPLHVPAHRRIQTASVVLWVSLLPLCLFLFFFLCTFPSWWPFIAVYLLYVYFDVAPDHGGRRVDWVRSWRLWRWFAEYFPISLEVEEPLDPKRKYVFGYHPHGIISMGAFTSIGTEALGISSLLPGINVRLLTLSSNFNLPIYRELLLSLGICSVSRRSCERILAQGPGNGLVIVVGGAAESLNAHPGFNDLTLAKRMGFIRVAIRGGADLVPVFGFGENDIFEQVDNRPGTKLRTFQKHFQSFFGFTTPMFHGRGIFNYSLGILPHRKPVRVVIGKPIKVEQDDNPTPETVQRYHQLYMQELQDLFDRHKEAYLPSRKQELRFVE